MDRREKDWPSVDRLRRLEPPPRMRRDLPRGTFTDDRHVYARVFGERFEVFDVGTPEDMADLRYLVGGRR